MDDFVKIFIEVPIEGTDNIEIESVWALPQGKGFKLDNIPFYARSLSFGDVVLAEKTEDVLKFVELLEPSGHSTVRLFFEDLDDVQPTRETLKKMGVGSEISDQPRLVAFDIPPSIEYEKIKAFLDEGKENGRWDYEESALGFL